MRKFILLGVACLVLVACFGFVMQVDAAETMPVDVRVWNWNTSQLESSFYGFPSSNHNGADVAVGDIDGDNYGEIVVAAGRGSGPHVRVFTKKGVVERIDFFPFKQEYRGGLSVAVGDVDGDGKEDIAVAPKDGQARVRVYKANNNREIITEFLAYPESFTGGANIALGDFDNDGKDEIAVSPGTAGGPQVRLFEGNGQFLNKEFFAFGKSEKGGASLAAGDIDGDGIDELFVGHGPFGDPWVKTYRVDQANEVVVGAWRAYDSSFRGGVKLAAGDLDQDGKDEVITGAGYGGGPHVQGWTPTGTRYKLNNMVYNRDFRGSFNISAYDIDRDGKDEIVTIPDKKPGEGRLDYFRYIDVSIGEQRLRAYENAQLVNTYLVSTGTGDHPTPTGTFEVQSKVPKTRMSWEYGPDHPDNYDLADVPHVLGFDGPYTIHGAYWHSNFGHRMSHGCVNESLPDAAWLYNWARVGDAVIVH